MSLNLNCLSCGRVTALAAIIACLVGASTHALPQERSKPSDQKKWRPKDGFYVVVGTEFTGPCEDSAQYFFELSKKRVTDHVSFGCSVTKINDIAPGALRLDLTCDDLEVDEKRLTKDVMMFRRIDDQSFFMRMSHKGKLSSRELQVNYCPEAPIESK